MLTRANISMRLRSALTAQGVLVAAHRGTTGGHIVENTTDAYENALKHRADIVEIDIVRSTDGELFLFHDGNEPRLLRCDRNIRTLSSEEITSFTYRNPTQHETRVRVNRFEEALRCLKGRALINADRCWGHWDLVFEQVGQAEMFDQVLFKSPVRDDLLDFLEAYPVPVLYMPIVRSMEDVEKTLARPGIHTVGLEMVFDDDNSPLADPANLARWKQAGLFVWANPITLDDRHILSGGHDDNAAILRDMDWAWGWLLDRGFNVLQTDWPLLLKTYIESYQNRARGRDKLS